MKNEDAKRLILKAVLCTHVLLFLSAAHVVLAFTPSSYALPQTVVRLEPAFCSAFLGQTFSVDITVADVQNLYGLEVDVSWNASVLEIAGVDVKVGQPGGALCSPMYIVENSTTTGQYILAVTSVPPAPSFNGTGTAATLTFRVKNPGNSTLSLTSQLYDFPPPDREPRTSLPIEHATLGSMFEETIPEISSLPLLAVLVAVAVSTAILSLKKLGRSHTGRPRQKAINGRKG
jgi:hypothetical protein